MRGSAAVCGSARRLRHIRGIPVEDVEVGEHATIRRHAHQRSEVVRDGADRHAVRDAV